MQKEALDPRMQKATTTKLQRDSNKPIWADFWLEHRRESQAWLWHEFTSYQQDLNLLASSLIQTTYKF